MGNMYCINLGKTFLYKNKFCIMLVKNITIIGAAMYLVLILAILTHFLQQLDNRFEILLNGWYV